MTDAKIINLTAVSERTGIKRRTLYAMIKDGRFPVDPIRGTKPRLWDSEAIDAWRKNNHAEL